MIIQGQPHICKKLRFHRDETRRWKNKIGIQTGIHVVIHTCVRTYGYCNCICVCFTLYIFLMIVCFFFLFLLVILSLYTIVYIHLWTYIYIYIYILWTTWKVDVSNYKNCIGAIMPTEAWVDVVKLITLLLGSFLRLKGGSKPVSVGHAT